MLKSKSVLILTLLFIGGLIGGCKPVGSLSAASGTNQNSGTSGSGSSSALVVNSSLYITLQGNWENTSSDSSFSDESCYVPAGTLPAVGGTVVNCSFAVPELTLHHSDITFQVGTNSTTTCALISFQPYYFMHNNSSAVYQPQGAAAASTIDCSGATQPIPLGCYGGVAPTIVGSSFPGLSAVFFLPVANITTAYTTKSSQTVGAANLTSDASIISTNTYISNNNATPAAARTVGVNGVDYVANSQVGYSVSCLDPWGNPLYILNYDLASTPTGGSYDNGLTLFYAW